MTPQQEQAIRDRVESEALLADTEIIFCEGAFMCACEKHWFYSSALRPFGFAHCYHCGTGAIVVPWIGQ